MADQRLENIQKQIALFRRTDLMPSRSTEDVCWQLFYQGKLTIEDIEYYKKSGVSVFENVKPIEGNNNKKTGTPSQPVKKNTPPKKKDDKSTGLVVERTLPRHEILSPDLIQRTDATSVNTPKRTEPIRNYDVYDKNDRSATTTTSTTPKDKTSSKTETKENKRYIGEVALEDVLKQYKINIKTDDGKKIFDRLSALPQSTIDSLRPNQIREILENNKDFESIANDFEYLYGIQIRNNAEQEQVIAERKRQWGDDYREKEVALQVLSNQYDNAIALLSNYRDSQGVLNVGYWRENLSDGLKTIANVLGWGPEDRPFHFNVTDIIEHLQVSKQEQLARLQKHVHGSSSEFRREFYNITGKQFNSSVMQLFEKAVENDNKEEIKKYTKEGFGTKIDDYVSETISMVQGIDMAGDIGVMLIGAEFVGAGVMTNFSKGFAKLTAMKWGKIIVPMLAGGTTLATWTAFQGSVNSVTKKAPTTTKDLKAVGKATLESFGFGAFGGVIQQVAIGPLMRTIDKPAKQAVQKVATQMELNGEMSLADVVKTTMKVSTQDPSFIAKTAGFVTEVAGFTGYEVAEDILKDLFTDNENLPEDVTLESVTEYISEKFKGQLTNLGSIKAMSHLFMMMKGGRVGQQAVIDATLNNAQELNNMRVRQVVVDGKKQFEITNTKNKQKLYVETYEELIKISQNMLQLQFIANTNKALKAAENQNQKAETKVKAEAEVKAEVEPEAVKPEIKTSADKPVKIFSQFDLDYLNSTTKYEISADGAVITKQNGKVEILGYTLESQYTPAERNRIQNYSKVMSDLKDSNFENVPLLKNLTKNERIKLKADVERDIADFSLFITGNKPAVWCNYSKAFEKLNNDNIDIIRTKSEHFGDQAVLINKSQVKDIISNNKELYAKRLGLSENASTDEIYSKLISRWDNSFGRYDGGFNDITGLTLGYPRLNTLIFGLESSKPDFNTSNRYKEDLTDYKNELLDVLYSEESPYKNMSDAFKTELADAIKNITEIKGSGKVLGETSDGKPLGYYYMHFADEPAEIQRIRSAVDDFIIGKDNFSVKPVNGVDTETPVQPDPSRIELSKNIVINGQSVVFTNFRDLVKTILPVGYDYYVDKNGNMQIAMKAEAERKAVEEQATKDIEEIVKKLGTTHQQYQKTYKDILYDLFGCEITMETPPARIHEILSDLQSRAAEADYDDARFKESVTSRYSFITEQSFDKIRSNIVAGVAPETIFDRIMRPYIDSLGKEAALAEYGEAFFAACSEIGRYTTETNGLHRAIEALANIGVFRLDGDNNLGIRAYIKQNSSDTHSHTPQTVLETEGDNIIFKTRNKNGTYTTVTTTREFYDEIIESGLFANPESNPHGVARLLDPRLKEVLAKCEPPTVQGLLKYLKDVFSNPEQHNIQVGFKMSMLETSRGCVEVFMPEIEAYVCLDSEGKITTIIRPVRGLMGRSWKELNVTFDPSDGDHTPVEESVTPDSPTMPGVSIPEGGPRNL